MASLARLGAVAAKEAREILRDPVTLLIAVILPLLMMVLFTYAITLDVRSVALVVLDQDGSLESREYVGAFLSSGYFRLAARAARMAEVEAALVRGTARLALVIPPTFSRDLGQGLAAPVQVLADGSFSNTAILALAYANAVTQAYADGVERRALAARAGTAAGPEPAVRLEPRVRYNPALRNEPFVVPGLFAVILMAFPPLLAALAVVRERERGSIHQLYASPLRPWEFVGGKLLPYAGLALLEMGLLLGAGTLWFGVPVRGSAGLLLGLAVPYVTATVGIGLWVSAWTRSQVVALLLAIVLTFMPALLFSGFLFSIESMPWAFRGYTYLFPARYFTAIARGITLKGLGLGDLWPQAFLLLAYGAAMLVLAGRAFRKKVG